MDLEHVLGAVDKELDGVREQRISRQELDKARNQVRFRFVSRLSRVSRIGELLADYALLFDDANRLNQDLDLYLNVTEEDILDAAQRTFRPQNRTLIVVEPGK